MQTTGDARCHLNWREDFRHNYFLKNMMTMNRMKIYNGDINEAVEEEVQLNDISISEGTEVLI